MTRAPRDDLSAELVRSLLSYDSETGIFTWNVRRGSRAPAGGIAGSLRPDGYRGITINARSYLAHRLVWLVVNGTWPFKEIDHRDGNRSNNAIANLREATSLQQQHNRSVRNGFWFDQRAGKYKAKINVNKKQVCLGTFDTSDEARSAYLAAHSLFHGDFSFCKRANP